MTQSQSDYLRIEKALRHLAAHRGPPLSLDELARAAGVSSFHFQRLFTRWAGISPKAFQQFLRGERARELLRGRSVLEAALELEVSGPGRLHDLTIKLHALRPGELRAGARPVFRYGYHPTPFGECFIAATERGITDLWFIDSTATARRAVLSEAQARWPGAEWKKDPAGSGRWIRRIFRDGGAIPLVVKGTPFQLKVWQALLRIPEGETRTYSEIARAIGAPAAVRAAASAIAANGIAYLIPCHRVLRETCADFLGSPGGYRWGSPRKSALLLRERAVVRAQR